jgi:hypothetical protein
MTHDDYQPPPWLQAHMDQRQARWRDAWRSFRRSWQRRLARAQADGAPVPAALYADLARAAAAHAYAEDFTTHWGCVDLGAAGTGYLLVTNNHPYRNDPQARDRELARFRAWLATVPRSAVELAYATAADDYSYALLLRVEDADRDEVTEAYMANVRQTLVELDTGDGN